MTTVATPSKCAGPAVRPAQHFGDPRDMDAGRESVRIDLLHGWGEQDVGAGVAGQFGVALLGARIRAQVLVRAELGGVDEQRHDDQVVLGAGPPHQRRDDPRGGRPSSGRARRSDRPARASRTAARTSAMLRRILTAAPCPLRQCPRARTQGVEQRRAGRAPATAMASRCRATVRTSPRATGPVSAALRAVRRPVLHGAAHERCEHAAGFGAAQACGSRRDLLGRREQRHDEVRSDGCGGVVAGALVVRERERVGRRAGPRAPAATSSAAGDASGDGASDAAEGLRAFIADERLQRMQSEVHSDLGQRGGAGHVSDEPAACSTAPPRRRRSRRPERTAARHPPARRARPDPIGPFTSTPAARSPRAVTRPSRPRPTMVTVATARRGGCGVGSHGSRARRRSAGVP